MPAAAYIVPKFGFSLSTGAMRHLGIGDAGIFRLVSMSLMLVRI